MLDLLLNKDLDDRDVRLLLLTDTLQQELGQVRRKDLAKALSIDISTVGRRFRRLHELGVLKSVRKGSKVWEHNIVSSRHQGAGSEAISANLQNQKYGPGSSPSVVTPHPDAPPPNVLEAHSDAPTHPSVGTHPGERSPHILITNNNKKERIIYSSILSVRAVDTMKVSGPDDALMDLIRSSQKMTEKAHEEKLKKRKNKPLSPGLVQTYSCRRQMAHDEKEPSEYNVNDMEIIFGNEWRAMGLKGKPVRWTQKERGQLKDMIVDQSPEVVAGYLSYVFANWEDLRQRFRIQGYPSVPSMYGFRRTWLSEYVNGKQEPLRKKSAEYDATEDIPSGSWG